MTGKIQSIHPLWAAAGTSALAAVANFALPDAYSASAVGAIFLAATYVLALRERGSPPSAFGLDFAGLLESGPLDFTRILRSTLECLAVTCAVLAVVVPAFWIGFLTWHQPTAAFSIERALWLVGTRAGPWELVDLALGHLFVVALPEEAFFRGYLQSALDRRWPPRWRLLGAAVGPALIVTSAVFALGHLATTPTWSRLAVFFPSLLFGWLRARTGGVGTSILVHAAANMLVVVLVSGYDLD